MSLEKITKTFTAGSVLKASELNGIVTKFNSNVDETAEKGEVSGVDASVHQLAVDNAARDFRGIPTMGGQPMVLFCSAETPAEATVPDNWKQFDPDTEEGYNWDGTPTLIGQRYVYTPDSGDGAEYVAVRADATAYTLRWMKV